MKSLLLCSRVPKVGALLFSARAAAARARAVSFSISLKPLIQIQIGPSFTLLRTLDRTFLSTPPTAIKLARMSIHGGRGAGEGVVRFPLSSSSALIIQKGDITKWSVDGSSDAIVNPANEGMLGGGGADGAIHRAAGPELLEACYKVPEVRRGIRCPTGKARITPGFKLPASHVIHTVGPIYYTDENPEASLSSAYRNSLIVAIGNNIQYIAFPAISCGVYRYPYDEAAKVAISTIKAHADGLKEVHVVLFLDVIYDAWLSKARELLQN